jgi:agmatinase
MRQRFPRDLSVVEVAILGVPFDMSTSNRPGACFGPRSTRELLVYSLGEIAETEWFDQHCIVDYGDTSFPPGDMDLVLLRVETDASSILAGGTNLLALGGDYTISLPLLRVHGKALGGKLSLVHFDSHTDLYDVFPKAFHGNPMALATAEGWIDPLHSAYLTFDIDFLDPAYAPGTVDAGHRRLVYSGSETSPSLITGFERGRC